MSAQTGIPGAVVSQFKAQANRASTRWPCHSGKTLATALYLSEQQFLQVARGPQTTLTVILASTCVAESSSQVAKRLATARTIVLVGICAADVQKGYNVLAPRRILRSLQLRRALRSLRQAQRSKNSCSYFQNVSIIPFALRMIIAQQSL